MSSARRLALALVVAVGATTVPAASQQLLLDRGVRAAGLWCFPSDAEPKVYRYLPSEARLARDDRGNPQFSFVRYVATRASEGGEETITAAEGGAVLHFLVLYDTPDDVRSAAERELRRLLDDDEVRLGGPVPFEDGRYSLVSSIVRSGAGEAGRAILATGRAPVLEGNRIALSFDLEPEASTLLLESFRMAAPDLSLVFDMTFSGLTPAFDAELTIDWSEVHKNKSISAGGSLYFVGVDVEITLDELLRDHAISLRSSGSDAAMEALLDTVYQRLVELMFQPVEPEAVPEQQRGDLAQAVDALLGTRRGGSNRGGSRFGLYGGYRLKNLRSEGRSVLSFDHRASVERHGFITFNIGDLYRRYGEDPDFFRTVNLADPAFRQREVRVAVDGALLPEFERFVNSVTLTLRKRHQSGAETLRELVLDRRAVERAGGDLRLIYGWDGDDDREAWLSYQYRARWSFQGGGSYETEWLDSSSPMIDLFAPYERRRVQVLGEPDSLRSADVRAVVVRLEYPFFGEQRRDQIVLRTEKDEAEGSIEITLPLGVYEYDYLITWLRHEKDPLTASGRDATGVLFVDEPPTG